MWDNQGVTPPSAGGEPLPPELQAIAGAIDTDAAAWRRRVPPAEPFNRRVRRILLDEHPRDGVKAELEDRMVEPDAPSTTSQSGRTSIGGVTMARPTENGRRRPPLSAVAAILVVALLAGIFAILAQNRASQGGATATTTEQATPEATATAQTSGKLPLAAGAPVTGLAGVPVVAPSDPRVIYEYADNTGVVVRRSDNGGATWGKFLLPNFTGFVSAIELAVNPADAHNVFLRLDLGYQPGDPNPCAKALSGARGTLGDSGMTKLGALLPGSGGLTCTSAFVSRDGGGNWSPIHLPIAGSLFQTGVTFTYDATAFQAQPGSLYGRVWQFDSSGSQTGDIRIVRSGDEGQTWQAIDAALLSQAGHICAFSATPAGATVFALVSTANCWNWSAGIRAVWRSDDAGGHWSRAGGLPTVVAQPGVTLTAGGGGAQTGQALLYALPGTPSITGLEQLQASADGGQTWSAAPRTGLPAGAQPLTASQTPLADGSLVVAFAASNAQGSGVGSVSCYAWRPGTAAWRLVTPAVTIAGFSIANLYVSNGQSLAVTISVADNDTTNPTYTLIPFA